MRRVSVSKGKIVAGAILGAFISTFAAAPARAGSFTFDSMTNTYTYVGDPFNFCGYGCPANAPSDPRGADYLIATLTFGSPLAPNLMDVIPVPTQWTMTDHWTMTNQFNVFFLSGVGTPPNIPPEGDEPEFPGLVLSTDSSGNIIEWFMSARVGTADSQLGRTGAFIVNPPIFCGDECNGLGITDFLVVNERSIPDKEWDALVLVPEPGTLMLVGVGLLALVLLV
jgi:hypothetical protein